MDKKVLIATHDGMFHSDDVFAVAALLLMLDKTPVIVNIVRTRDEEDIRKADFVVDVGSIYDASRNRFDHHQVGGAGSRQNGIPYTSFGLVWAKFGKEVSGSENVADSIDQTLVAPVDAYDAGVDLFKCMVPGVAPRTLDDYIHNLRPTWQEETAKVDERFLEAVGFARKVLEREIAYAKSAVDAKNFVLKAYENAADKRLIILDLFYPNEETLTALPEPLFVIYPRLEGSWNVKAVRDDLTSFKNRLDLPESWAGKRDAELAEVTGVKDAIFCHTARFLAVAKSKEGAVRLAEIAIGE
jgi:uncharacterized UPF0160 family protein